MPLAKNTVILANPLLADINLMTKVSRFFEQITEAPKRNAKNCCEEWHTDSISDEKYSIGDDNVRIELKSKDDVTVEYCEKCVDQSVSTTTGKICNPYKNRN